MATETKQAQQGATQASPEAQLRLHQRGHIIQQPGTIRNLPIALDEGARLDNARALNLLLADTIQLYHMYKKHHWQVAGHTFYQLHLLFDKHAEEQEALIDLIAERVQQLGDIALGMPTDVVKSTRIENPPQGAEEVPVMVDRLLEAHETIIKAARELADQAEKNGDYRTNDMMASELLRTNEMQVWFVGEHVVATPATIAHDKDS
jgi:starvation-inducible DNA-binding protein